MTKQEFIEKARKVHGDKYDYRLTNYEKSKVKVCIICPKHGEFWQIPNSHLRGNGCPKCGVEQRKDVHRETLEGFVLKAKNIHGNKYDYSKVHYVNTMTKVCIICPKHGEFWQTPNSHLSGNGCPKCAEDNRGNAIRSTKEDFIKKAKQVHKSGLDDYSKVEYVNSRTKVCIICRKHGEYYQSPDSHLMGRRCPKCKEEKLSDLYHYVGIGNKGAIKPVDINHDFIRRCKEIHGDKYDYSKTIYTNNKTKVCIICPKHGEFWQTPNEHLGGCGCPKCAHEYISKIKTKTKEEFILEANKIHNGKYDYSNAVYNGCYNKITVICPKHGKFEVRPSDHLNMETGCPLCGRSISRNENEIFQFVKNILGDESDVTQRVRDVIKPYELDIFAKNENIAIEYDGLRWHSEEFVKDKYYHLKKLELCKEKQIKLIHIFEDEFLEHKYIVFNKLLHIFGKDSNKTKIYARKCTVNIISNKQSKDFLEVNHIQGYTNSTIHLGCFLGSRIVGVMSFKKERRTCSDWELTRFATDINYHCVGIGGKLFAYFIREYNPGKIKSFADRRWTMDENNNLYTKLGFNLTDILKPDYRYVVKNKRIHKFNMRKQTLLRRYPDVGLTPDMTEKEMCYKLGFYRIWDCGLLKYEWFNKN